MAKGHKDKIAVITGAANGIGAAFAKRLAEDGVHIAVVDLAEGGPTAHVVQGIGRNAIAVQCDVAKPDAVAKMARDRQEGARRARHRDQLRRHLPAARFSRTDLRRVAQGALDQPRRHVPRYLGLCARHGAEEVGPGDQYVVVHARLGHQRLCALHVEQGRHRRLHPRNLDRSRALRHHRERDLADPDALARGRWRARRARSSRPWTRNSRRWRRSKRSSASRCRKISSAPCRFSPAMMRPSSPGKRSTSMAGGCGPDYARGCALR